MHSLTIHHIIAYGNYDDVHGLIVWQIGINIFCTYWLSYSSTHASTVNICWWKMINERTYCCYKWVLLKKKKSKWSKRRQYYFEVTLKNYKLWCMDLSAVIPRYVCNSFKMSWNDGKIWEHVFKLLNSLHSPDMPDSNRLVAFHYCIHRNRHRKHLRQGCRFAYIV